jgi:hypothetical protein
LYSEDGLGARRLVLDLDLDPRAVRAREATLEDVFLRLTGRDLEE